MGLGGFSFWWATQRAASAVIASRASRNCGFDWFAMAVSLSLERPVPP